MLYIQAPKSLSPAKWQCPAGKDNFANIILSSVVYSWQRSKNEYGGKPECIVFKAKIYEISIDTHQLHIPLYHFTI